MNEQACGKMDIATLEAEIKRGPVGAYLFYGDEDYIKSHYRDAVYRAVMSEGMEAFNYFSLSFSPAAGTREKLLERLSDAVDAVPMMQDRKLIVVTDLAPSTLTKEQTEAFFSILERAASADDTVLLIVCRADELVADYKLEASALYKKLIATVKVVRFDLLTQGKLIAWAKKALARDKVLISDEAASLLTEMTAGRMMPLSRELQKLSCYAQFVKGGEPPMLEESDVRAIVSVTSPDEIPFAMLQAAQSFKLTDMLAVIRTAKDEREEPIAVLARLSRIYLDMLLMKTASEDAMPAAEIARSMKMKDFRVSKMLAAISRVPLAILENSVKLAYETDCKMKSTSVDPWVLLDRMIVDIYAPKSLRHTKEDVPCS